MPASENKWSWVFDEPTRILVVDDDPILREFASVYLSAPLSRVDTVADAPSALELLSREDFDIVLVDIEMPGMNGFELVQRIRAEERLRTLPVVIITAREDIASIDQAYTVGATSFTSKPINWRLLSYQLRYVIRASKAEIGVARPGGDVTAPSAAPSRTQDELAGCLNTIIDTANRIAGEQAGRETAHARAILAAAQFALQGVLGTRERTEGETASTMHQPPRVA